MVLGCGLTGAQGGVEEEMQLLTNIGVGDTGHVIHTYIHTYMYAHINGSYRELPCTTCMRAHIVTSMGIQSPISKAPGFSLVGSGSPKP